MKKWAYIDSGGNWIDRRSNWSRQKGEILKALISLEHGTVSPTARDDGIEAGFFDVEVIARHIFGCSGAFINGKLNRGKRSTLNKSLHALYLDGFIDKTGSRYQGSKRGVWREFYMNHWRIIDLGQKIASFDENITSSDENIASRRWRKENRFYGVRDIKVDRSQVKRIAASDYAEDWD